MKRKIIISLVGVLTGAIILTTACSTNSTTTSEADVTRAAEIVVEEDITSFEDLNTDKVELIALGNSDVPVGQYAQEVLENMGFWDGIQSKITFGDNVKEVLSQVEEAAVDCGVVYATDASTSDGVKVVCSAPEGTLETPVLYPVAMLKESKYIEASEVFLDFILTEEALLEFEKVGFTIATDLESTGMEYTGDACTITVFAAASLTESLTSVCEIFMEVYPEITVITNLDSSGTLKTQIEEGAEADIFFSAATKQMTALSEQGYIAEDTKINVLENEVVLIVPAE